MATRGKERVLTGKVTGIKYIEKDEDDRGNTIQPMMTLDNKVKVLFKLRQDEKLNGISSLGEGGYKKWDPVKTGAEVEVKTLVYKTKTGGSVFYAGATDLFFKGAKEKKLERNSYNGKGGSSSYNNTGAAAGHAVTNAVNVLLASKKAITETNIKEIASVVALATKELMSDLEELYSKKGKKKERDSVSDFNDDDETEEDIEAEEDETVQASADDEDTDDEIPF